MTGKVVVYGRDPILLLTRRLILERAGFTVFTTSHLEEEVDLMAIQEPQILILCHSLPTEEAHSALMMTREIRPQMKTLVMLQAAESLNHTPENGAAVYALEGPEALLTAVHGILTESSSASHTVHPSA
jgi:DNA-binding response OmpR family regulator